MLDCIEAVTCLFWFNILSNSNVLFPNSWKKEMKIINYNVHLSLPIEFETLIYRIEILAAFWILRSKYLFGQLLALLFILADF